MTCRGSSNRLRFRKGKCVGWAQGKTPPVRRKESRMRTSKITSPILSYHKMYVWETPESNSLPSRETNKCNYSEVYGTPRPLCPSLCFVRGPYLRTLAIVFSRVSPSKDYVMCKNLVDKVFSVVHRKS